MWFLPEAAISEVAAYTSCGEHDNVNNTEYAGDLVNNNIIYIIHSKIKWY